MSYAACANRHDRIRRGGMVRRYHTVSVHEQQNVAAHSWGVAALLWELVDPRRLSTSLLLAAMFHDVAEYETGDVPHNAKANSKELHASLDAMEKGIDTRIGINIELDAYERVMLKVADMMELLWFCLEEQRMGNTNISVVFIRGMIVMNDLQAQTPAEEHENINLMLNYITQESLNVCK